MSNSSGVESEGDSHALITDGVRTVPSAITAWPENELNSFDGMLDSIKPPLEEDAELRNFLETDSEPETKQIEQSFSQTLQQSKTVTEEPEKLSTEPSSILITESASCDELRDVKQLIDKLQEIFDNPFESKERKFSQGRKLVRSLFDLLLVSAKDESGEELRNIKKTPENRDGTLMVPVFQPSASSTPTSPSAIMENTRRSPTLLQNIKLSPSKNLQKKKEGPTTLIAIQTVHKDQVNIGVQSVYSEEGESQTLQDQREIDTKSACPEEREITTLQDQLITGANFVADSETLVGEKKALDKEEANKFQFVSGQQEKVLDSQSLVTEDKFLVLKSKTALESRSISEPKLVLNKILEKPKLESSVMSDGPYLVNNVQSETVNNMAGAMSSRNQRRLTKADYNKLFHVDGGILKLNVLELVKSSHTAPAVDLKVFIQDHNETLKTYSKEKVITLIMSGKKINDTLKKSVVSLIASKKRSVMIEGIKITVVEPRPNELSKGRYFAMLHAYAFTNKYDLRSPLMTSADLDNISNSYRVFAPIVGQGFQFIPLDIFETELTQSDGVKPIEIFLFYCFVLDYIRYQNMNQGKNLLSIEEFYNPKNSILWETVMAGLRNKSYSLKDEDELNMKNIITQLKLVKFDKRRAIDKRIQQFLTI